MFTLIKHHFQTIDLTSSILIPSMLCFFYLTHMPPTFLFVITVISLPIIIYFSNHKNKVDHFIISLPVDKKGIIKSRYLFTVIMATIILVFQLLIMFVATTFFGGTQYVYSSNDIVTLLCLATIVPAITIPIYHLIRSFIMATTIIGILFFISVFFLFSLIIDVFELVDIIIFNDLDPGLSMVVEKFIPYQPFPILIIISIVIFHVSIFISQRLYILRDV